MKSFIATIENFIGNGNWGHHFLVPKEVSDFFLNQNQKRVICTLNDIVQYQCAIIPNGGSYFINVNAENRKILQLEEGSDVTVTLEKDESEFGIELPEEAEELLLEDPEFAHFFNQLTKGKQRSLLYLINQPKGKETRIKKALVIANHLKEREGDLDFKILNQDFKAYNELLKKK